MINDFLSHKNAQRLNIHLVDAKDFNAVVKLVTDVFMEFVAPDYSKEGITSFLDTTINDQGFMSNLTIYGAYLGKRLIGIIATRNEGNHIVLFFVDGAYHGQGIGRKLFEVVLKNATSNKVTVNSAPYAKEIYHHLGFKDTNIEQVVAGIWFTPMEYKKGNL